ncbi:MAG: YfhO family protein [Candidatus Margulisiibacteriota bacterium]
MKPHTLHCNNEAEQKKELSYKEILLSALIILFFACIFFWQPIITGSTVLPTGNIFEQDFYHPYAPKGYSGPPNYILQDQSHILYPQQKFAMEALANGKLPLWNPHIMLGSPILGTTQTAVLYPPNLLATILSSMTVILIRAIFNLWMAGFLMYILIRRLGAKSFGAYIAAIAFMFCGFLVVWLGHPHSNSAIWLPGMVLMAELTATSRYKRGFYVSITGFLIALSFLGGHLQTSFEITVAWFLYLMVRSFQVGGWKWLISNLWMAILSVALAVGAAAVQILPFLEWLGLSCQLSDRSSAHFVPFFTGFWRNCLTLATLVLPNLYSNPSQTTLYASYLPWTNFNEMTMYVGIIPLLLGIYGLSLRENKHIPIFAWGALLFLALALRLPLIDWINQLPVFKLNAPGRYRLIFDFGIAAAAGLTLNALMEKSYDPVRWRKLSKVLLLLGGVILAVVLFISLILPVIEKPITDLGRSMISKQYAEIRVHRRTLDEVLLVVDQVFHGMLNHFSLMNWKLYFPGLAACLVGLWIIIWQRAWFGKTVFRFGIVFLVLIDLFIFGIGYNPSIRPEFVYPDTPAVKFLKQDKSLFRIMPIVMQWNSNGPLAHGLTEVGGYEQLTKYFHNFRNVIAVTEPFNPYQPTSFLPKNANSRLMDLLNVKYIVTSKKMDDSIRKDIQLIWQDHNIRIYRNYAAMPRAFFVNRARYLTDDDMLKALRDPSFDPAAEVLLSLPPGKETTMSTALPRDQHIAITKYEPERVQISTTTSGDGMLVISDAYYPGWYAYMDGEEVPIFRANYVMRAISLPKGHHYIEFRYEPLSVIWGLAISLTALILMGIISIVSFRKFRKVRDKINKRSENFVTI